MLAMLGAAAQTGMPNWCSIRCLQNVAAWAELPRAHVTTSCGGLLSSRPTSSRTGRSTAASCRNSTSGTAAISRAIQEFCSSILSTLQLHRLPFLSGEEQSAA